MGSNEELTEAIKNNDLESVKGWVEQSVDLRADDDWVLRWAAANGNLEVVKYLLEQGADLHAENDWAQVSFKLLDGFDICEIRKLNDLFIFNINK